VIDRLDYVLEKTSRARDDFAMISGRAVYRPALSLQIIFRKSLKQYSVLGDLQALDFVALEVRVA